MPVTRSTREDKRIAGALAGVPLLTVVIVDLLDLGSHSAGPLVGSRHARDTNEPIESRRDLSPFLSVELPQRGANDVNMRRTDLTGGHRRLERRDLGERGGPIDHPLRVT